MIDYANAQEIDYNTVFTAPADGVILFDTSIGNKTGYYREGYFNGQKFQYGTFAAEMEVNKNSTYKSTTTDLQAVFVPYTIK